jgi:hypothetical protein
MTVLMNRNMQHIAVWHYSLVSDGVLRLLLNERKMN